jgi:integrin beta 3
MGCCTRKGKFEVYVDDQLVLSGGQAKVSADSHDFTVSDLNNAECYTHADGRDYVGQVHTTRAGKLSQRWSEQYPHHHTFHSADYPSFDLGAHNYCRNPDGSDGPWCLTTDPASQWAYCDVPEPQRSCGDVAPPLRNAECYVDPRGEDYAGFVHHSASGALCDAWNGAHTPPIALGSFYGSHNFCRNPDGESAPWCFTSGGRAQWETCDLPSSHTSCARQRTPAVPMPNGANECYAREDASDYRGTISGSQSGRLCERWPSGLGDGTEGGHNFCRNPDGEASAWCFVDLRVGDGVWELCQLPPPSDSCGTPSHLLQEAKAGEAWLAGTASSAMTRGGLALLGVMLALAAALLAMMLLGLPRRRRACVPAAVGVAISGSAAQEQVML